MRIEGSCGLPRARVQRAGGGTPAALPRGPGRPGGRLLRARTDGPGWPPAVAARTSPTSSTVTAARACTVRPSTGATATGRVDGHRLRRRRPAPRVDRRRGVATRDRRRRHRRVGTGRRHGGRRAHRGRLDGGHRREGPQPPPRPRRPDPPGVRLLERRDQVPQPVLPRPRPAGRAPHLPDPRGRRGPRPRRRGQLGARPRSGAGAPTPTARCPGSGPTTSGCCPQFGPQPDADVADWPLDYDELEPYYAEVERAIGVAGTEGANPFAAPRSGPFPMPSGAPMFGATRSAAAAERLGYHPYPAPTAANSVPYDGRPACNNCGFCAFFGCPIHAKGDPDRHAPADHGHGPGRAAVRDLRVPDPHRGPTGHRGRRDRSRRCGAVPGRPSRDRRRRCHRDAPAPAPVRARPPAHRPVPDDPLPDHHRRLHALSGPTASGAGR